VDEDRLNGMTWRTGSGRGWSRCCPFIRGGGAAAAFLHGRQV